MSTQSPRDKGLPLSKKTAKAPGSAGVKRSRGRPPLSEEEARAARMRLQLATAHVFAEHGYHGVSVELVLKRCGASRPTFYRYFRNIDEALDHVLHDVNASLISAITGAVRAAEGPLDKVEAGLAAWRKWGQDTGPILKAIFAEMHDPNSPAARHRKRVLEALGNELNAAATSLGRPAFDPLQVETFVIGIEYLGYAFFFNPEGPTEEAWTRTRHCMLRLAVGMLGGPFEWAHAAQLADTLGIDLR